MLLGHDPHGPPARIEAIPRWARSGKVAIAPSMHRPKPPEAPTLKYGPSTHTTTGKTTMSSISPSRLREAPLKIDLALLLAMSHRTELHSRRCHGEASLLRHKGPQILDEHCG